MLKNYLKEHDVRFEDINVAADQQKAQEMIDRSGQMGVPVADIHGEIIVGFDKERINEALRLDGSRAARRASEEEEGDD